MTEHLRPGCEGTRFARTPKGTRRGQLSLLSIWFNSIAGHHGSPPVPPGVRTPLAVQFPHFVVADVLSFIEVVADLVGLDEMPFELATGEELREARSAHRRLSWSVAGWAVLADWLGSNTRWFPFVSAEIPLAQYWQDHALPRARRAVEETGVSPLRPSRVPSTLNDLFFSSWAPTPLQCLSSACEVDEGAQLFIIEELTGGGKTEAALILAHRLMKQGAADRIFIALPTMATANAMHARVLKLYETLFESAARPVVVLAHSHARLSPSQANQPFVGNTVSDYGAGDVPGEVTGRAWLASSNKRALLSHVGVGTIDQVLLGVLPVRHQSLRLFGLARSVLIVDEVHAADTYVRRLLCSVLEHQASVEAPVILMSATLPQTQKEELVKAYCRGISRSVQLDPRAKSNGYPLLTRWSGSLSETEFGARQSAAREVVVSAHDNLRTVRKAVHDRLKKGECVCWVRNTVADAIEEFLYWRDKLADNCWLFHSRFAFGDRADIEGKVLRSFGRESGNIERCGRLLIATQVVEQSLDIDFDFMVSDLAPIDLLIQRAGRLQRHARDHNGRLTDDADQRAPAELAVLMPEPRDDASYDWFADLFPRGAFVYPDHGQLWLTARWVADNGRFRVPGESRAMIEWVYSDESFQRVPEALQRRMDEAMGQNYGKRSTKRVLNLVQLLM